MEKIEIKFSEEPYFMQSIKYLQDTNDNKELIKLLVSQGEKAIQENNEQLGKECLENALKFGDELEWGSMDARIYWLLGDEEKAINVFTENKHYDLASKFLYNKASEIKENNINKSLDLAKKSAEQILKSAEQELQGTYPGCSLIRFQKAINILEEFNLTSDVKLAEIRLQEARNEAAEKLIKIYHNGKGSDALKQAYEIYKFQLKDEEKTKKAAKLLGDHNAFEIHGKDLSGKFFESCTGCDEHAEEYYFEAETSELIVDMYRKKDKDYEIPRAWKKIAEHRKDKKDISGAKRAYISAGNAFIEYALTIDDYLKAIEMFKKAGMPEVKEKVLWEAIRSDKRCKREPAEQLAEIYINRGNLEMAADVFEVAGLERDRGKILLKMGETEKAKKAFIKYTKHCLEWSYFESHGYRFEDEDKNLEKVCENEEELHNAKQGLASRVVDTINKKKNDNIKKQDSEKYAELCEKFGDYTSALALYMNTDLKEKQGNMLLMLDRKDEAAEILVKVAEQKIAQYDIDGKKTNLDSAAEILTKIGQTERAEEIYKERSLVAA
jgi:hypothetical protein